MTDIPKLLADLSQSESNVERGAARTELRQLIAQQVGKWEVEERERQDAEVERLRSDVEEMTEQLQQALDDRMAGKEEIAHLRSRLEAAEEELSAMSTMSLWTRLQYFLRGSREVRGNEEDKDD